MVEERNEDRERTIDYVKWLGLIMSLIALLVAGLSLQKAEESNTIAKNSLESSRELFLVEKRPYINVFIEEREREKYLDVSQDKDTATLDVKIQNEGGLPAKDITMTIYFIDGRSDVYSKMEIVMPPDQKILPGKFEIVGVTSDLDPGSMEEKAIMKGKLELQVVVSYSSDLPDKLGFTTRK